MVVSTPNLLGISESVYDTLVADATASLKSGNLTFGEILSLGGKLTTKVAALASLSVQQKKFLVVDILQKALDNLKAGASDELSAKVLAASEVALKSVPFVFDAVVDTVLDVVQKKAAGLLSSLSCGLCASPVAVLTSVVPPVVLRTVLPVEAPVEDPAAPVVPAVPAAPVVPAVPVPQVTVDSQETSVSTQVVPDVETTPVQSLPNTVSQ